MPVAVEAFPFLGALAVVALILGLAIGPWAALPVVLLALFVLWFFRDPERSIPGGEGLVLSPADGRVTGVEDVSGRIRITIFLSVFNCHINRSPIAGTIIDTLYTPGRYLPAFDRRAGQENERNHLTIRAADGEYGVTQIAGLLARRIVCRRRVGDALHRGERFGMIRFGSRTDLLLPPGVHPLVAVGDRVHGGLTIMARHAVQHAAQDDRSDIAAPEAAGAVGGL
jgi:phosphatidylserine decarboxylase